MIDRHGAFLVGYTVPLIGIHFNCTNVLAEAGRGATGELQLRVSRQIDSFKARAPRVVQDVRLVLSLLEQAGIDAGPPPKFPADYYTWADRIDKEFNAQYGSRAETVAINAARLVGYALGNALLTLNVAVITEHLRAAVPKHEWLTAQARDLGEDQMRASTLLAKVAASPFLPEAARDVMQEIATDLGDCPEVGTGEAAGEIAPLQTAMRAISEKVPRIEQSFQDAPPPAGA